MSISSQSSVCTNRGKFMIISENETIIESMKAFFFFFTDCQTFYSKDRKHK